MIEGYKKVVKAKQAVQAIAEKSAAGMEVGDLEKGAALDLVYEAVDYNRENMIDDYEGARQAYKKAADLWFEALDVASERRKGGAEVLQDEGSDNLCSVRSDRDGKPVVVIDRRSLDAAFRSGKKNIRKMSKTTLAAKVEDGKTLFQVIKSSGKKFFWASSSGEICLFRVF